MIPRLAVSFTWLRPLPACNSLKLHFSVFLSIMEWAFDPIFKVDAPLIPKIKSKGDTSQFQDYEENEKLFRIGPHNVHAKDFEDFWGGPKYKQKVPNKCKQTTSHSIIIFFCWYGFLCFIFCFFLKKKTIVCCIVCWAGLLFGLLLRIYT